MTLDAPVYQERAFTPLYPLATLCGLLFAFYGYHLVLDSIAFGYVLLFVALTLLPMNALRWSQSLGAVKLVDETGIHFVKRGVIKESLAWESITRVDYRSLWSIGLINSDGIRRYRLYRQYYFHFHHKGRWIRELSCSSEAEALEKWAYCLSLAPELAERFVITHKAGDDPCANQLVQLGTPEGKDSVETYLTAMTHRPEKPVRPYLWVYPFLVTLLFFVGVWMTYLT